MTWSALPDSEQRGLWASDGLGFVDVLFIGVERWIQLVGEEEATSLFGREAVPFLVGISSGGTLSARLPASHVAARVAGPLRGSEARTGLSGGAPEPLDGMESRAGLTGQEPVKDVSGLTDRDEVSGNEYDDETEGRERGWPLDDPTS